MERNFKYVPSDLWLYNGHFYDLSAYVGKHPGGEVIRMAKGTDCTELVQQIHPFSKERIHKLLKKYEVPFSEIELPPNPKPAKQNPSRGPVFQHFLQEVQAELDNKGLRFRDINQMSFHGWCYVFVWALLFYLLLVAFLMGWSLWLVSPLLGIAMAFHIQFVMHESSHFCMTQKRDPNVYISLYAAGVVHFGQFPDSYHWNHHLHTNDVCLDQDLFMLLDFMRYLPHQEPTKWSRYQHIFFYVPLFALLAKFANLPNSLLSVFRSHWLKPTQKLWYYFVWSVFLFLFYVYPFLVFGWTLKALWAATIPTLVQWGIFFNVFAWNHFHNEEGANLGYSAGKAVEDCYFAQVLATTQNVKEENWVAQYHAVGIQIQHHLLPTVSNCWLHLMVEPTRRTAKHFGIPYHHTPGLLQLFRAQFRFLYRMGRQPKDETALDSLQDDPCEQYP